MLQILKPREIFSTVVFSSVLTSQSQGGKKKVFINGEEGKRATKPCSYALMLHEKRLTAKNKDLSILLLDGNLVSTSNFLTSNIKRERERREFYSSAGDNTARELSS